MLNTGLDQLPAAQQLSYSSSNLQHYHVFAMPNPKLTIPATFLQLKLRANGNFQLALAWDTLNWHGMQREKMKRVTSGLMQLIGGIDISEKEM